MNMNDPALRAAMQQRIAPDDDNKTNIEQCQEG